MAKKAALHSLPSRVKAYAFHLLDMATAIKVPAANKRGTRSTEGTGDGEYEKKRIHMRTRRKRRRRRRRMG